MNPDNVIAMIKEGVMVGPANQQAAEIGRGYTEPQNSVVSSNLPQRLAYASAG